MSFFKVALVSFVIFGFLGCGSAQNDGDFQSSNENISTEYNRVTGEVDKGPIKGSLVKIYRVDTGELLGSSTTDDTGKYSIKIGNYSGAIKVTASGGTYVDEIDGNITDASGVTLEAFAIVDDTHKFTANVTPFTSIAAKNLGSSPTSLQIINENKKVAKIFIGEEFDLTKITPQILNQDTITDSPEGKYGTMLAVFSKIIAGNPSNIPTKITEFYDDYKSDEVADEVADEIKDALTDSTISQGIDATIISNIKAVAALEKIKKYADDNSSDAPSLQDYVDAGISGVTEDNLAIINFQVAKKSSKDIATVALLQSLVENADFTKPTVIINDNVDGVASSSTGDIEFTFSFSEDVTGFSIDDINLTGGSKKTFSESNASVYTLSVTPDANSTEDIAVYIPAGVVIDLDGNPNEASSIYHQPVDTAPPVFTSPATVEVSENQTSAITLQATGATSYAISDGDSALFDINSTSGVVTFKTAPDFETKSSYTFIAKAMDEYLNTAEQNVTINIKDIDESAPTLTSVTMINSTSTAPDPIHYIKVGETVQIDFTVSEETNGTTPTVTIAGVNATVSDKADNNSSTWRATLTMTSSLNEGPVTFSIKDVYDKTGNVAAEVTSTTDGSGLIFDKTPPTISNSNITLNENTQTIFTISATDALSGIKADSFGKNSGVDDEDIDVDRTSGVVTFINKPDYEFPADSDKNNVYNIQIAVDDKAGNTATKDISVTIANVTEAFTTVWNIANDGDSITIPTTGTGYNYSVDWGDGSSDSAITGDATHTYSNAGSYTIKITGQFPRIYFNNSGDKDKITMITSWGDISWSSMENAFYGCSNLDLNATDKPVLGSDMNFDYMFKDATSFNGNIENWDTTNVTTMNYTLYGTTSFSNHDLSNWNVSNVTSHNEFITNSGSGNIQPLWTQ